MIRIVLLGRTGNNLFQYALGRVLAEKHGVPLVLDATWFNANGWKEASHFLTLPLEARVLRAGSLASRTFRKLTAKHRWQHGRFPFLIEHPTDHTFNPSFLDAPANCALFGYFQSWKYFAGIEEKLRDELSRLLEIGCAGDSSTVARASCPELLASLASPSSVAVHVRRGDFMTQPVFQVCDTTYYLNAMEDMRSRIPDARFFVFSDDPSWCGSTFTAPDTKVINSATLCANPLHDLRLMSQASHHIIANSSYSWWAAWIGKKANQRVILPDRWFQHTFTAPMEDKNAWSANLGSST